MLYGQRRQRPIQRRVGRIERHGHRDLLRHDRHELASGSARPATPPPAPNDLPIGTFTTAVSASLTAVDAATAATVANSYETIGKAIDAGTIVSPLQLQLATSAQLLSLTSDQLTACKAVHCRGHRLAGCPAMRSQTDPRSHGPLRESLPRDRRRHQTGHRNGSAADRHTGSLGKGAEPGRAQAGTAKARRGEFPMRQRPVSSPRIVTGTAGLVPTLAAVGNLT